MSKKKKKWLKKFVGETNTKERTKWKEKIEKEK